MQYEILEHTGDAKIKAFGKTKEELFLNAMLGMNAILKPRIKNPASVKTTAGRQGLRVKKIDITSTDINSLLVDFLNEVNYLRQVGMEVYDKIEFTKFFPRLRSGQAELEGELKGYKIEGFGEDIKAVTFHKLGIKKNEEGVFETCIVFDM